MISFEILDKADICKEKFAYPDKMLKKLNDYLDIYGEGNVGVCQAFGTVLLRIFDTEKYFFVYPDSKDTATAVDAIRRYCVKEEISLIFKKVPGDCLSSLCGGFLYSDVRIEDFGEGLYTVIIKNECDLLASMPRVRGRLSLSPILKKDIYDYSRICRDESGLKFFGYDYREDVESVSDEYFYHAQLSEFNRSVSLTLGVRYEKKLIGEAALYAFDYLGGAELSFRLLPEYRGKGLGRLTLEGIFELAETVGLRTLYATVDERNIASLSLISQYMDDLGAEDGRKRFILRGEEI